MFADFYSTFATVSLTVTGLWFVIASVRFQDWMGDRDHFRRASSISVQLAFPGIMCLFALIDPDSQLLWQYAFGVTSAVAIFFLVRLARRSSGGWAQRNAWGNRLAVVLFACICVVAAAPDIVEDLGPRRIEFFLFSLLLLDGMVVAWLMLFDEHSHEAGTPV